MFHTTPNGTLAQTSRINATGEKLGSASHGSDWTTATTRTVTTAHSLLMSIIYKSAQTTAQDATWSVVDAKALVADTAANVTRSTRRDASMEDRTPRLFRKWRTKAPPAPAVVYEPDSIITIAPTRTPDSVFADNARATRTESGQAKGIKRVRMHATSLALELKPPHQPQPFELARIPCDTLDVWTDDFPRWQDDAPVPSYIACPPASHLPKPITFCVYDSPSADTLPLPTWPSPCTSSSSEESTSSGPSSLRSTGLDAASHAGLTALHMVVADQMLSQPRPIRAQCVWAANIAQLETAAAAATRPPPAIHDTPVTALESFCPLGLRSMHEVHIAHLVPSRRCFFSPEIGGERLMGSTYRESGRAWGFRSRDNVRGARRMRYEASDRNLDRSSFIISSSYEGGNPGNGRKLRKRVRRVKPPLSFLYNIAIYTHHRHLGSFPGARDLHRSYPCHQQA
ncbi:hypothetical protein K488DRAFT_73466 [Vararia minispora EC-137]|uniref:Uncharacterized protein n=1 Tax=Vararia minispora EC-137 TaxID=1314806 RepID=A0ACB8QAJ2_9AGAM|nr:hypothetical protein K488DRAFT_73466 [Vararia minispora EC-137]